MIDAILRFTLPAAYAELPLPLASPEASALLLAIGLQESAFLSRQQLAGGPARGFWMFERSGIAGVLTHPRTAPLIVTALEGLRYPVPSTPARCLTLVEDNDVLACIFARLLLWTVPETLPIRATPDLGWKNYLDGWRPGKPRPADWVANFSHAWDLVSGLQKGLV